jgi:hypothetical protein
MNNSISDKQILELFNNKCNCISYDEVYKHRSLKSLLAPYGFAIILYVWKDKPNYLGHWVYVGYGFNEDKNKIIIFDSLGHDDIDLNSQVDYPTSIRTHQDYPYLSKLIVESRYDTLYNSKQIQQSGSAVCARYSCFCAFNLKKFKNFEDFLKLFNKSKLSNDKLILKLTENYF